MTQQSSINGLAAWAKLPKRLKSLPKPPAEPAFDHWTFRHFGNYVIAVYDNHVWHWREGHGQADVEHAFRETWLLKQTSHGFEAQWVIYGMYGVIPVAVGQRVEINPS
jgi:hypothetical protein